MSLLRYVTHPHVEIDPDVPVPHWGLSQRGREQVQDLLAQPWLSSVTRVVSSAEMKAVETATTVGQHLRLDVEVRPDTGETDRSSTGYVPHDRHEALADRFFAEPEVSAEGWERAVDAQARMVGAVGDLLAPSTDDGDIMVVGHGAVGTLLFCHLTEQGIARRHDQPGAGCYWTLDRTKRLMLHGWQSISAPAD